MFKGVTRTFFDWPGGMGDWERGCWDWADSGIAAACFGVLREVGGDLVWEKVVGCLGSVWGRVAGWIMALGCWA